MIVNGDPNYFIDINNTGAAGVFRVRDDNGAGANLTRFTVNTDGSVDFTAGARWSGGPRLENTLNDVGLLELYGKPFTGTTKRFEVSRSSSRVTVKAVTSGDALRLEAEGFEVNSTLSSGAVTYLSCKLSGAEEASLKRLATNEIQLATTLPLAVSAGGDLSATAEGEVGIRFGTAAPDVFRLYSEAEVTPILEVDDENAWFWNQPGGSSRMRFHPNVAAGAEFDSVLTIGNDEIRGNLQLANDSSGANTRPGVLVLYAQDGTLCYLFAWFDSATSTYQLRVRRTNDPANTGGGTLIVGGIVTT